MSVGGISERARANLGTYRERQESFAAERAEAKRRNAEARKRRQDRVGTSAATRKKHRATVAWLPEPVPLLPESRVMVTGVCSDAADDVRARYL